MCQGLAAVPLLSFPPGPAVTRTESAVQTDVVIRTQLLLRKIDTNTLHKKGERSCGLNPRRCHNKTRVEKKPLKNVPLFHKMTIPLIKVLRD